MAVEESRLTFFDAQSCAIQEIHNLKAFQNKAREAMVSFCKCNLGRPVAWKVVDPSGKDKGANGALFTFYLFSAPVYPGRVMYGTQFAEFIRQERLGDILTTPALKNAAYHPDHANQIWIWMPAIGALNRWWKVNKTDKPRSM